MIASTKARTLFAGYFVETVLSEADDSWPATESWNEVGEPQPFAGVGMVRLETAHRRGKATLRVSTTHRNGSWSRTFALSPWATSSNIREDKKYRSKELYSDFTEHDRGELPSLKALAIESGVEFDVDSRKYGTLPGYASLFGKTERKLVGHRVNVPTVGLSVRPDMAIWLLAGVTFTLLVLIRSRIGTVAQDDSLAEEEPWLVLDARRTLEKVLASAWLFMIVLGPWILDGLLVWSIGNRYWSEGVDHTDSVDQAMAVSVVPLIFATGWTSLTTMSDILGLRRLRAARLRAPRQKAEFR